MSGVNKVILVGNLGKDPEVRFMPNGDAVANITVATSDTWKDKQTGEQKEKTEWHRIVIFGKLASIAGEYLKKGSKVYIEGSLQTRKWTNQQGADQYTTEIVLQGFGGKMEMLDGKPQGAQQQPTQAGGFQQAQQPTQQAQQRPTIDTSNAQFVQQPQQPAQQANTNGGQFQSQAEYDNSPPPF